MPDLPQNAVVPKVDFITLLGDLVRHGTESQGEAVVLMYDEEDGYFISTVNTGCHHYPVKEPDRSRRHGSLQEAVIAAAEWHNEKKDDSPWWTTLARMEMPEFSDAVIIEKIRAALMKCHNRIYGSVYNRDRAAEVLQAQSEFHAEVRKLLHEPMLDERR